MKIKYCLKIVTYDYFNGDIVRRYFYRDIDDLNSLLNSNIFPGLNFSYVKSMEIEKYD